MNIENKFARFMRNSGPARFFVPAGIILIVFGILGMIVSFIHWKRAQKLEAQGLIEIKHNK